MLGRLLGGAGMMRAGIGLMRRGRDLTARAKQAPLSNRQARTKDIKSRVQQVTRGIEGSKKPHLFSKHTGAGRKRRAEAAALIRGKRAGLPAGQTHASVTAARQQALSTASRTRSKAIVSNVKGLTRSFYPHKFADKKSKSGKLQRQWHAQFLREARQKPTRGYGSRPNETFYLRKPRKFQGPKI